MEWNSVSELILQQLCQLLCDCLP